MNSEIDVQFGVPIHDLDAERIQDWVLAASKPATGEICVRFMDEEEGRLLNKRFRQIDQPTNVLAFPANETNVLGDIAVCLPTAIDEAREQRKSLEAHVAHLVVHATLHLRGYDHEQSADAVEMEKKEIQILRTLGFSDPYRDHG